MKYHVYKSLLAIFFPLSFYAQTYNMSNSSVTACSGTFYDNGGSAGAYSNNQNLTFTICPSTPGAKVTVNFTSFNIENNYDFLTIYDGPNIGAPSMGSYSGSTAGGVIPGFVSASPTNTSGCLTFVFTSDGSVTSTGWVATIACTTPCITPTANIVSTSPAAVGGIIKICQGASVSFNGTITGGNGGTDTYSWNLGNGSNSTIANPTATYAAAGSYQVTLNGTEGGCPNTNSATVTVQVSTTPTFTSSATPPSICLGQSSNLAATVTMNPFTPNCTPPVAGTTFLPDGTGVSYTTAINVNCFNPGQTITSAANFSNLCLTLEHSYLGDLQISLICPNGQSMILKSYAAGGAGTYLGSPLDDPTVGPGSGFVYCFTPTATTPLVNGATVTAGVPAGPSIVAGNYAPEQPFTNMIGCPLNGAWTIQVTDNLAADNGYIFNWDVNFTIPGTTGGFTPTIATQGWNPTAGLLGTGATTATVTPTSTGNQCYTYSVTDNFGCTYTQNQCVTVNPNTPVNAGPDLSACPGQTITIGGTPTGAAGTSFSWAETVNNAQIAITGSTTVANPSVTLSPTASGSVQYTVTGTSGGCITSDAMTINVSAIPSVTVNNPSICSGSATVTATPTPAGTYTYVWTVPSGATNPGNVASFSTTVSGSYSVVITNAAGCSSTSASGTVTVSPIPTVTVNSPNVCASSATVTATPSPAGTYSCVWTVPSGATNPGNVATFSATVSGSYSVIITNTATGCSSTSSSGTVTINPNPTVTVNNPSICSGSATVTATPTPAGTYTYVWTVPSGATNPGNVASFSTTVSGSYSVVITNAAGCSSTSASGTVTVSPIPTVTVNSPNVCASSATVTATPSPAGTYSYVWTVPSGATNPGNVATFSATVSGSYSVIITNTATGCSSISSSGTVTINPNPTVTVNNPSICSGSATVTATPTPAGTYTYVWTVPSGATNPGNAATFTTSVSGSYSVIITNPTTGCSSTSASGTVTVSPIPTVTVNSPTICGTTATVTATPTPAGIYSYVWTVPSGVTNPGNVATFSATVSGSYSVIITNTATGCSSTSSSGTVTLNTVPNVTVNSPSACQNGLVTLTATPVPVGTYNYVWTVPAGVTNPGNVASFTASSAGSYSVVIADATTLCSSTSATGVVTINPNPSVTVNSPSICSGANATVVATPSAAGTYSYSWTVPSGATNPGNIASFSTGVSGIYDVIITNTTTGCVSTLASGTVSANVNPTVLVNDATVCQNGTASITATPTPTGTYNYVWTVPSGTTNPGNVSTFSAGVAGPYSVIITNTLTGCSSLSATGTLTVNSNPTVTLNSPSACEGSLAALTATPTPMGTYDFTWTVPASVANPGNVATFNTAIAGLYTVLVTNPVTGCFSTAANGNVTINLNPIVTVNNPITCTGVPIAMTATPSPSGAYNYVWTVPAGVVNPGSTASFNSFVAGTYSVVITNPTTGCSSTSSSGSLTVNSNPQPIFISDVTQGCAPLTVNFTNQTLDSDNCVWSISNGVQLTGCQTVTYTFTQAGCYDITLATTSTNGCFGTTTISNMICVDDLPNASFFPQNTPVSTLDPIVHFVNTSTGATSYVWNFGDSSAISNEIDPTHIYGEFEANYLVTLVAISDAGCVDTAYAPVQVQEELIYYIPNTFTPDADPINNVFEPVFASGFDPQGYTLFIFDRWGEILFESHNTEVGWDGTYNGSLVQDGTYIWKIEFKLSGNDGKVMDTGHVNLIR